MGPRLVPAGQGHGVQLKLAAWETFSQPTQAAAAAETQARELWHMLRMRHVKPSSILLLPVLTTQGVQAHSCFAANGTSGNWRKERIPQVPLFLLITSQEPSFAARSRALLLAIVAEEVRGPVPGEAACGEEHPGPGEVSEREEKTE